MAQGDQDKEDMGIFERFRESSGLEIGVDSVCHRDPPEPDIRCALLKNGELAFELVEVIDKALAKSLSDTSSQRQLFEQVVNELGDDRGQDFKKRYADARIWCVLQPAFAGKRQREAMKHVVDLLLTLPCRFAGDVELPSGLKKMARILDVSRGAFPGPMFTGPHTARMTLSCEDRLKDKFFNKKYVTDAPIELLAWYGIQPRLPESYWRPGLENFVRVNLAHSPFRRVWLFRFREGEVLWVYPPVGAVPGIGKSM